MVNYSNGKIYKIVCDTTKLVYIGSTTKKYLSQRLDTHRNHYKRWIGGRPNFITSFKVLENNNYTIVLLELVDCKSKDELLARERFYIETVECVNKFVPLRTKKEYFEANKEHLQEYIKEYYQTNKDIIKDQQKEYREATQELINKKCDCECGGKYTTTNKARHLKSKRHLDYLADFKSSGI